MKKETKEKMKLMIFNFIEQLIIRACLNFPV